MATPALSFLPGDETLIRTPPMLFTSVRFSFVPVSLLSILWKLAQNIPGSGNGSPSTRQARGQTWTLGPRPRRQAGARDLAAESPLKLRAGSESWPLWPPGLGSPKVSLCTSTQLPDPR